MRRALAVLAASVGAFVGAGFLMAPAAQAHPLGNFTVNRYSGLLLTPGRIQLTYVLDMAEIPTFQETPNIDTNGDGVASASERQAWADRTAPRLLAQLSLAVNGQPVALTVASDSMRFRQGQGGLPILYLRALFAAPAPSSGDVRFVDRNYSDRIGWKEITAASRDGVALAGSSVPATSVSHELLAYPVSLLASPRKVSSATFSFHPGAGAAAGAPADAGKTVSGDPIASGGGFAALVTRKLSVPIALAVVALAFLFGALHAMGPGHGKTIMAAYLVGEGARARQVVKVGLAVSLMHTASVLTLGLVTLYLSHLFPAERVYPWLGLVTGLVVVGLGGALLVVRARARRRGADPWHVHPHPHSHERVVVRTPAPRELAMVGAAAARSAAPMAAVEWAAPGLALADGHAPLGGGHDHRHGHGNDHEEGPAAERRPLSRRGLAALAVSGGILPSPTALVVLIGAVNLHRVGYGVGLIGAFSVGLAAALIAVGLLAIRARDIVGRRLGGAVAGALPILSAALIFGVGLFLAAKAAFQV